MILALNTKEVIFVLARYSISATCRIISEPVVARKKVMWLVSYSLAPASLKMLEMVEVSTKPK